MLAVSKRISLFIVFYAYSFCGFAAICYCSDINMGKDNGDVLATGTNIKFKKATAIDDIIASPPYMTPNGSIIASGYRSGRIYYLSPEGEFLWKSPGPPHDGLMLAMQPATGNNSAVKIAFRNNRISFYDNHGALLWGHIYDKEIMIMQPIVTPLFTFLATSKNDGSGAVSICAVDTSGDVIWEYASKKYPHVPFSTGTQLADNSLIVPGISSDVMRISANGKIIWQQYLNRGSSNFTIGSIHDIPDWNKALILNSDLAHDSSNYISIICVDYNGDEKWRLKGNDYQSTYYHSPVYVSSGNFVCLVNTHQYLRGIIALNESGNIAWNHYANVSAESQISVIGDKYVGYIQESKIVLLDEKGGILLKYDIAYEDNSLLGDTPWVIGNGGNIFAVVITLKGGSSRVLYYELA